MTHTPTVATVMVALLVTGAVRADGGDAHASTPPLGSNGPAHFKLANAARSVDALISRVLDALAKNDAAASAPPE